MHTQRGVLLQAFYHRVPQVVSTSKMKVPECSKQCRSSSLYGSPKHYPFLLSAARSRLRTKVKVQTSAEMASARTSTKWKISKAYTDLDSLTYGVGAFALPDDDRAAMKERSPLQGPKAWTYGEINFEGVQALQRELNVTGTDVFYDLGSGLGRMVFQVGLDWGVAKCVGIELSETRHNRAVRAFHQLKLVDSGFGDCIELRNENLLTTDMSDATVAYLACTCWDADFMEQVLQKLHLVKALRWVVSTEPLKEAFGLEPTWCPLSKCVELPMSWDSEWPVYIYECHVLEER